MITRKYELAYQPKNRLEKLYFTEDSIFFDIETTGFSPVKNSLYLIGCGYRKESSFYIVQFFAETKDEEADILHAFLTLLSDFHTILSFNGIGFDLPFLKTKCKLLGIKESFDSFSSLDIFKSVSKYKNILHLENYKQKTLEDFLEIKRDDLANGGELIPLYQKYANGNHDDTILSTLLLHNHDDVLGMLPLIQLLAYEEFFNGNYTVTDRTEHIYTDFSGNPAKELLFTGILQYPLPKRISAKSELAFLLAEENHFSLAVPIFSGTLKYFYPDYKNYYYLPKEDMAIHKSVATFVEKEFRIQAKAATCYTRKEGLFLPETKEIFSPVFKNDYKDKLLYFLYEPNKSFKDSFDCKSYVNHIFTTFT